MISQRRRLLAAASSAALLLTGGLTSAATAQPAPASTQSAASQPAEAWPQAASDVPADPAIRFGTLANGMRYAIMRNATPPNQAALRMRIDAGSLSERDDQKGLAHFLEHMAFNGSKHIPEGEMTRRLERLGLSFGGDTNAFTSFDQTAYTLNLPNTSDEVVETSLFVLRETASELLIAQDAVDKERGVIVGEERTRNTPDLRSTKAMLPFLAPGQRLADRLPIGDLDIIRTAPRQLFVDFYDAYYRPSRTTLIAVGDFDVDKMEGQIRTAFESWTNTAPDGPDPDAGVLAPRQAETRIHVEPGVQSTAQLFWTRPHDTSPDTQAKRRSDLVRSLATAVLNRRLGEITRSENPPFLGGGAGEQALFDALDTTSLVIAFNPGGWERAIQAGEQEQRRVVEHGVGPGELAREITEYATALQAAAAGAATRQTPGLASAILNAVNDDVVVTSPAENLRAFQAAAPTITVDEVNAAARDLFTGNGPLAFVTTPVAIEGGEAVVTAALEASRQVPVAAPAIAEVVEWPYADFGPAAEPVSRSEIADLGATLVAFPNGVKLTVKPTTFADDQILVSVRAGQGDLALPTDRITPMWAAPSEVSEGGLGKLTRTQLEQILAANVVGLNFQADADTYRYSGATRPADLALQMQLLAAYVTDAGWRPEPFALSKSALPQQLAQYEATPAGAFALQGQALLASGDRRFALPNTDEIEAARLDELRQLVTSSVSQGPIEIVVVGEVTVDQAIAAVASTFAALPSRSAAPVPPPSGLDVAFPAPTAQPVQIFHTGLANQALGYIAWPTVDSIGERKEARTVQLLARVLQLRVTDELREKQGAGYSPGASATSSKVFPGYGYVFAQIETPPELLPSFFQTVDAIAAELRDTPIDADELNRARLSSIEAIRRSQATNGYWVSNLEEVHDDPAQVQALRTIISDLEAVTPADIQRVARTYLTADKAWRAEVKARPEDAPASAD